MLVKKECQYRLLDVILILHKLQLQTDADCSRDCLGRVGTASTFRVLMRAMDHLFDAFKYEISLTHLVQLKGMIYQ